MRGQYIIFDRRMFHRESRITWHLDELVYIRKNFATFPAGVLLDHINRNRQDQIGLTTFRSKCRAMGLLKCKKPANWNKREAAYLANHYLEMGNLEIAAKLNAFRNKSREFTEKSVEKKMKLMGLKRSPEVVATIRAKQGFEAFQKSGVAVRTFPEGKKVIRRNTQGNKHWFIKHNGRIIPLHRLLWEKYHGPIPAGHGIYFKDGNTLNCTIENLICQKGGGFWYRKRREEPSRADFTMDTGRARPSSYNPKISFPTKRAVHSEF